MIRVAVYRLVVAGSLAGATLPVARAQFSAACCYPDGSCTVDLPDACFLFGGTPQGPGTDCSDPQICDSAEPPACCFADGSCVGMELLDCVEAGGLPQDPGSTCATADCASLAYDFGDAPDAPYPTLAASTGAAHVVGSSVYLGAAVDADGDGQPAPGADGDDEDGTDDEDGVNFLGALVRGATNTVAVTVGPADGWLSAWIDYDGDGHWTPAEQIGGGSVPLVSGTNAVLVAVPSTALLGYTYARFRISAGGGLSPTGAAPDGEVEDYRVFVAQRAPTYPIRITSMAHDAATATVAWAAESEVIYRLEREDAVREPPAQDWMSVGAPVTGPVNLGADHNAAVPGRTYRVVAPDAVIVIACCFGDGTCSDLRPAECLFAGGVPQGPHTTCATPDLCPEPEACCLPDGSCADLIAGFCEALGGVPQGPGSDCLSTNCPPPPEACCLSDGSCVDVAATDCLDLAGIPEGPGSSCASVDCNQQACCFSGAPGCLNLDAQACIDGGGTPKGPGTRCPQENQSCPTSEACCLSDGSCVNLPSVGLCAAAGGTPLFGTCATVTCPQP